MFRKDFKVENFIIDYRRSFSLMRLILKDNDLYQKTITLANNEREQKIINLIIEYNFELNEILPYGLDGALGWELNKTIAFIDSYQVVLSLIAEGLEDNYFKELMEDIRMSMQNFLYFIVNHSFYSAMITYRKIVEGALWINYLVKNPFPNDLRIDGAKSYSNQLKDYPNIKKYFKESSELIHAQKIVIFNWYSRERDDLAFFEKLIQNCYEEIEKLYNSIFEIRAIKDCEVLNKFSKIYLKLPNIRKEYELIDHEVGSTFNKDLMDSYAFFEKCKKGNKYAKIEGKLEYAKNLDKYCKEIVERFFENKKSRRANKVNTQENKLAILYHFHQFYGEKYKDLVDRFFQFIEPNKRINELKEKVHMSIKQEPGSPLKNILKSLKNIAVEAYYLSHFNNEEKLTQLRSILEDLIFNFYIGKPVPVEISNLIIEIIRKEDQSISLKEIIRYKHILVKNRIMYVTIEGKETGTENVDDELLEELIAVLRKYLSGIKK